MKTQEPIIDPIAKELLLADLKKASFVKEAKKRNQKKWYDFHFWRLPEKISPIKFIKKLLKKEKNKENTHEFYTFSALNCPNLMQEIGRLREMSFRSEGGGTGKSTDIDRFDIFLDEHGNSTNRGFFQLITWDPEQQEIVGGYRYAKMATLIHNGTIDSPSGELFEFSNDFVNKYAPITIELGRSFVQPKYQKEIHSLENLFEGLGTIAVDSPEIKHFFGKVTMYKSYHRLARNMILYYLDKYCKDNENLLWPKPDLIPEGVNENIDDLKQILANSPKRDFRLLKNAIRNIKGAIKKITIPPLFKQYHDLTETMRYFGTSINYHFGEVEETAIMVNIEDIPKNKREVYFDPYIDFLKRNRKFKYIRLLILRIKHS